MRHVWRFVSPSTLLFALLLFPLPWVEIQCSEGRANTKVPGTSVTLPGWAANVLGSRREVYFTQSGWQAATGAFTSVHVGDDVREQASLARLARQLDAAMLAAPALLLFPACLFVGIVAGLALPIGHARRWLLAVAAIGALTVGVMHYANEFPLKQAYRQVVIADGTQPNPARIEEDVQMMTRATGWFWLAQFGLLSGLGVLLAEWAWQRRQQPIPLAVPAAEEVMVSA